MLDYSNAIVANFGKISFVPKNHTIPALPDMNLIVFKKETTYQAICIDIEVDAAGNDFSGSCDNLKHALQTYIELIIQNNESDVKAAVQDIVNTVYSPGVLKSCLFNRYLEEKHRFILGKIAKGNKAKSRSEEFINACKRVFQIAPIQFDLTLAAGSFA